MGIVVMPSCDEELKINDELIRKKRITVDRSS